AMEREARAAADAAAAGLVRAHARLLLHVRGGAGGAVSLDARVGALRLDDAASDSASPPAAAAASAVAAGEVEFPPRPRAVPPKPYFFDVAFDAVAYPSAAVRRRAAGGAPTSPAAAASATGSASASASPAGVSGFLSGLDDDDALRLIDLDLPGDVGSDDPSVSASDGAKTSGFQGDADSMSRHHLDGSVNEASATIASDDQHQHQPRQRPPRRARQQQQQQQRPARLMAEPRESALSSPFGGRQLDDSDRVFEHNAWDNVAWTPERAASAAAKEAVQRARPAAAGAREAAEAEAAARWDRFYASHRDRFFKDRRWLRQEFPELFEHEGDGVATPEASADEGGVGVAPTRAPLAGIYPEGTRHVVFEVGCGAGNT
ncbi:Methyltransferase-like protein 2-A, partial [Cladochytrium tenue]